MLVLLIIFMITAPLLTQGVKVDLPKAGAEPLDPKMLKDAIPLVLSVDRAGALYLNIGGGNPQTPWMRTRWPRAQRRCSAIRNCRCWSRLITVSSTECGSSDGDPAEGGAKKVGFITDPLLTHAPRTLTGFARLPWSSAQVTVGSRSSYPCCSMARWLRLWCMAFGRIGSRAANTDAGHRGDGC